jgi:hypothetical protein
MFGGLSPNCRFGTRGLFQIGAHELERSSVAYKRNKKSKRMPQLKPQGTIWLSNKFLAYLQR